MTGHAPIYTPQDLAALVAKHDREHPDHAEDCGCHNGLIGTLRVYFAPAVAMLPVEPRPYIPPDVLPPPTLAEGKLGVSHKPWLAPRSGETNAEYDYRIAHSCFNCGAFIVDSAALNHHEDDCASQGRRHDG